MPKRGKIVVSTLVESRALQGYPIPEDEEPREGYMTRYIEAIVNQRFEILIKWLPGFPVHGAQNVMSEHQLDTECYISAEPVSTHGTTNSRGSLKFELEQSLKCVSGVNVLGKQVTAYQTFGALGIGTYSQICIDVFTAPNFADH